MNLYVVVIILVALIGLSFLAVPMLAWIVIWLAAIYALLQYGMTVPIPASVISIYLGLTALGLFVYVVTDAARYENVKRQLLVFLTEKRFDKTLKVVVVMLPLLLAYNIYSNSSVQVKAPGFARTVHPAPPGELDFKGKRIDLLRARNPYRELQSGNAAEFHKHVENGKRVYYQNCVFCHGDDLRGDGMYAHGLNPAPANFNSATTIAMLQEAYLFWRIAKGGPGLPEEAGPWSSSMPAWESFLSEEEIWDVILFLYEHTALKPRAEEELHE